jgi:hypothetical protein
MAAKKKSKKRAKKSASKSPAKKAKRAKKSTAKPAKKRKSSKGRAHGKGGPKRQKAGTPSSHVPLAVLYKRADRLGAVIAKRERDGGEGKWG